MTTLILVCLAYNPVAPEDYLMAMEKANAVQTVIENFVSYSHTGIESTLILETPQEPKKEVKKVSTKKQTKSKSGYDTPQGDDNSYRAKRVFEISKEMGYGNPTLALRIIKCESGLRENAKNPNSSASGFGQHLRRYWPARATKYGYHGASVFNGEANLHVTIGMLRDGGTSPRNESKGCWGKIK